MLSLKTFILVPKLSVYSAITAKMNIPSVFLYGLYFLSGVVLCVCVLVWKTTVRGCGLSLGREPDCALLLPPAASTRVLIEKAL